MVPTATQKANVEEYLDGSGRDDDCAGDQRTGTSGSHFLNSTINGETRTLPQIIAHRGYKKKFPENTLKAFEEAVRVGADAVETDVRVSKDGVVVLCHDPTLSRVFGVKRSIEDCEWEYLRTLRTRRKPREGMARLVDLLGWLVEYEGARGLWVLLDIKYCRNMDRTMQRLAHTFEEVKSPGPWQQRVVLGCWSTKLLPLISRHLPLFPITHIGFSIEYARNFLPIPNISFTMSQSSLRTSAASKFLKELSAEDIALFVWTLNDGYSMKWAVDMGVNGVITDDPKLMNEIRGDWEGGPVGCMPVQLWTRLAVEKGFGWFWRCFFKTKWGRVWLDGKDRNLRNR